jgi:hypothetical protein
MFPHISKLSKQVAILGEQPLWYMDYNKSRPFLYDKSVKDGADSRFSTLYKLLFKVREISPKIKFIFFLKNRPFLEVIMVWEPHSIVKYDMHALCAVWLAQMLALWA